MSHFSSDTLYSMDQKPFPFFHPSFKPNNNVINIDTTSSTSSTVDQEYMFEKPLTPSDVGKLNRLVIPKQHAEKYFPLSDVAGSNGGVLLGFEDETGKCWKFRYSYWNSSQSYVLTKGWSRYVKDKKLYAGDVVLFQRHRVETDRFFIGWRRRGSSSPRQCVSNPAQQDRPMSYRLQNYMHEGTEVRQGGGQKVIKSGVANSKRVRLFGVNLECQILEEELEGKGEVVIDEEIEMSQTTISDGSPSSSHGQGQVYHAGSGFGQGPTTYNFDYMSYPSNHHYNSHMDMNFPQDVNQISNSLR